MIVASKKKVIGIISVVAIAVIVTVLFAWVVTSPPLMPAIAEKYAIPEGSGSSRGYNIETIKIGGGWVSWCFTLFYPEELSADTPWSYRILISKISDNVTGLLYRGLTLRVNNVLVEDAESGSGITDNAIHTWFDGETITILVDMIGEKSINVRQILVNLDYDICAILAVGYLKLESEQRGFLSTIANTSKAT